MSTNTHVVNPGDRFGLLTVIEEVRIPGKAARHYRCLCVCGGETTVRKDNLLSGRQRSCSCEQRLTPQAQAKRAAIRTRLASTVTGNVESQT